MNAWEATVTTMYDHLEPAFRLIAQMMAEGASIEQAAAEVQRAWDDGEDLS